METQNGTDQQATRATLNIAPNNNDDFGLK
jgi:hypothetical protein